MLGISKWGSGDQGNPLPGVLEGWERIEPYGAQNLNRERMRKKIHPHRLRVRKGTSVTIDSFKTGDQRQSPAEFASYTIRHAPETVAA
jgi:hypothetical protein